MNRTWLKELWSYRELLYFFVWRDIKVKYKQSLLGIGWALLQPLAAMVIFTLFFGRLANVSSDGLPYPVFSYAALLPWTYFSTAIGMAGNSLVSNANMIGKVYFPRLTLPLAAVLSGLIEFAIGFAFLLVLLAWYRIPVTGWLALFPVFLGAVVVLGAAVGMFLAALHVRYRDVKYVLPFLTQLWLFVTPVIYPVTFVPEQYRMLLALNPLSGMIDAFRTCVHPSKGFDLPLLGVSLGITLVLFAGSLMYFRKTERWFADVI